MRGRSERLHALILTEYGVLYYYVGDYHRAEELLDQALEILEQRLDSHGPQTANALIRLGFVYSEQGRHTEAERVYRRGLRFAAPSWANRVLR